MAAMGRVFDRIGMLWDQTSLPTEDRISFQNTSSLFHNVVAVNASMTT